MTCDYCDTEFEPTATRWLCPACHQKMPCCDGAPLPITQELEDGHGLNNLPYSFGVGPLSHLEKRS